MDMKYSIVDGSEKMNIDEVMRLLRMTYWADKRPAEQIEKSMQNSSCYGVRLDDRKLVGFARVISDYATNYYLCDVIIDTELYIVVIPVAYDISRILEVKGTGHCCKLFRVLRLGLLWGYECQCSEQQGCAEQVKVMSEKLFHIIAFYLFLCSIVWSIYSRHLSSTDSIDLQNYIFLCKNK